jgi:hypothetical protein
MSHFVGAERELHASSSAVVPAHVRELDNAILLRDAPQPDVPASECVNGSSTSSGGTLVASTRAVELL